VLTNILEDKYLDNTYGLFRRLLMYQGSFSFYSDIDGKNKMEEGFSALNNIELYRSFIFADSSNFTDAMPVHMTLRDISLPFDKIFIETPVIPIKFTSYFKEDDKKTPFVLGCFYEESSPGNIHASTICLYIDQNNMFYSSIWSRVFISEKEYLSGEDGYIQAKILHNLMNFKKSEFITGLSKAKEKTRNGREIISDIVIVHKSNSKSVETKHSVRIDWKHCWEVSGHFRRIRGLGKDRSGQRRLPNITWVVPHIRGDIDMPLIKKERLFPGELH
jgi:hypothetical protein